MTLRWTTKRPTRKGRYLQYHTGLDRMRVVQLRWNDDRLEMENPSSPGRWNPTLLLTGDETLWSGPLDIPESSEHEG